MAAGFHERKVNGDICPVMKNFELSVINHPPLGNHSMSASSNFKNNLRDIFTSHGIQKIGKQVFHWWPNSQGCKSHLSSFQVHDPYQNYCPCMWVVIPITVDVRVRWIMLCNSGTFMSWIRDHNLHVTSLWFIVLYKHINSPVLMSPPRWTFCSHFTLSGSID